LIILFRNPKDSIASILKLTKDYYEAWDTEKANRYYCERLEFLNNISSQKQKSDVLFIDSDQLIINTDSTLARLSQFLELDTPLSAEYKRFSFTGVKGDPGEKISKGKIILDKHISTDFNDTNDLAFIAYSKLMDSQFR